MDIDIKEDYEKFVKLTVGLTKTFILKGVNLVNNLVKGRIEEVLKASLCVRMLSGDIVLIPFDSILYITTEEKEKAC